MISCRTDCRRAGLSLAAWATLTTVAAALPPFIRLGPSDNLSLDQPRVAVLLYEDSAGTSPLGPSFSNTFLLDSASSSILVVGSAVNELNSAGYQVEGTFEEFGVAGSETFDVSASYRFDFAGTSGLPNSLADVRVLSKSSINFGGFNGILGTPGMVGRVTSLDMTIWSGGNIALMGVDFADTVPAAPLPGGEDHRYRIDVRPVHFDPLGDPPLPTAAPLPFVTARVLHEGSAHTGNFAVDTGAQISIISTQVALNIGLDTNGNGTILDERIGLIPVGGIGGSVNAPILRVDEFRLPTTEGVELAWDTLELIVLDIDPSLDGVVGSDLLTSGWLGALWVGDDGYLNQVHFDLRNMPGGNGELLLDVNPALDDLQVPGDTNADDRVDDTDLLRLAARWQAAVSGGWPDADFNGDNRVDVVDLAIMSDNWEYGVPMATGNPPDLEAAIRSLHQVPEPGGYFLAAVGLPVLLIVVTRRRC